jgi:hypothetical protein
MSLSDSGSGLTDRIVLLKNLHRPLEEHWAGNKKVDALSSDYMFKHHITRLEKVYTTKDGKPRIDMGPPQMIANVSPQTLLFGRGGINPELSDGQLRRRERGWDPYTAVHHPPPSYGRVSGISEPRKPPPPPRPQSRSRSRSRSPTAQLRARDSSNRNGGSGSDSGAATATATNRSSNGKERGKRSKRRANTGGTHHHNSSYGNSMCLDTDLTREECILMGMYRLETEEDFFAYNNFVAMLRRHDAVDKLKIMQDAYSDAQASSLLTEFGGLVG